MTDQNKQETPFDFGGLACHECKRPAKDVGGILISVQSKAGDSDDLYCEACVDALLAEYDKRAHERSLEWDYL